jgi:hypothetical protein
VENRDRVADFSNGSARLAILFSSSVHTKCWMECLTACAGYSSSYYTQPTTDSAARRRRESKISSGACHGKSSDAPTSVLNVRRRVPDRRITR